MLPPTILYTFDCSRSYVFEMPHSIQSSAVTLRIWNQMAFSLWEAASIELEFRSQELVRNKTDSSS